jgi:hypothetical protein
MFRAEFHYLHINKYLPVGLTDHLAPSPLRGQLALCLPLPLWGQKDQLALLVQYRR